MLRVVLDTSVIAAAFRSKGGPSNRLLRGVGGRLWRPLVTTTLFYEYEAVLKRSEQRSVSGFSLEEIDRILAALASAMEPVELHFRWRPQLADPSDEMVLEAAINGRAEYLVTHNIRDFGPASRFGVEILRPDEFLRRTSR
jgi:putative PIN family toxin of toxin-antitoxin system